MSAELEAPEEGEIVAVPGGEAALADDLLRSGAASKQAGGDIAAILAKKSQLDLQAAANSEAAAAATGRQAVTLAEAALATQTAMQEAVRLLDADIMNPQSLKARSMTDFVTSKEEAASKLQAIKESQQVTFFDNPMEYIVNQMELPNKVQDYNITAIQANTALRTVNEIDSTLTAEAAAQKAAAKTLTTQSVADSSIIAAQALNQQAMEWKGKAMGADVAAIQAIKDGDAGWIKARMDIFNIAKTEEGLARQREAFNLQKQQISLALDEKEDKAKAKALQREIYRAGMAVYQMPIDDTGLDRMAHIIQNTPGGKERMQHIMDAGILKLTKGINNVGFTPGEASYNLVKTNQNWGNSPSAPATAEVLRTAQMLAANKTADPRKIAEFAAAVNEYYFGKTSADGKTKTLGEVGKWNVNPETSPLYKDPGLQVVAASALVNETRFYKEILEPSVIAKTQTMTPTAMVKAGLEAVRAGKLTVNDVAFGVSRYYDTVTKINAMNNSVVAIPPQSGYRAKIADTGILFANSFDMSKESQVTAALLEQLSTGRESLMKFGGN